MTQTGDGDDRRSLAGQGELFESRFFRHFGRMPDPRCPLDQVRVAFGEIRDVSDTEEEQAEEEERVEEPEEEVSLADYPGSFNMEALYLTFWERQAAIASRAIAAVPDESLAGCDNDGTSMGATVASSDCGIDGGTSLQATTSMHDGDDTSLETTTTSLHEGGRSSASSMHAASNQSGKRLRFTVKQ